MCRGLIVLRLAEDSSEPRYAASGRKKAMRVFVYEYTCARNAAELPPSLCAEGAAMLGALVADLERGGARTVTLLHAGWPHDPATEESAFCELARTADWTWAVAPEFGGLLAERCRWTHTAGGRWLGPTPSALELTADKLALATHLRHHGVPTPACQLAASATAPVFPAVCKPRYGAGSQATFLVPDAAALAALLAEPAVLRPELLGEPLLQPYLSGIPASVTFLIGPHQTLPLTPALQHVAEADGFRYLGGELPLAGALAARAVALAALAVAVVPGLLGYVGVDLLLGDADAVLEINPRLTTSYLGLRALCRDNLAAALLRLQRGEDLPPLVWHGGRVRFDAAGQIHWG